MATTTTILRKRVERGCMLLDTRSAFNPPWDTRIDCDILEIADSTHCIFGQLYGSFTRGKRVLCLEDEDVTACGFLGKRADIPRLNTLWETAINARMH